MVADGNVTIEKNRLAGVFPQWGPIFRVSFELKIDSTIKLPFGWTEVLRVTDQGADNSTYVPGRSVPAFWFCSYQYPYCGCGWPNKTCLQVASYISNDWNKDVYLNISRDRFVAIEIAQWVMDGIYFYYVYMDGKLYAQMPNGTPANFTNVNVFMSDNYDVSFGDFGQVRNLEVATWDQQPTDCYISNP